LWNRLVRSPDLGKVRRPLVFQQWLPVAAAGAGVLLLVVAGVVEAAGVRVVAALLAGVVLTLAVVLFVVSTYVRKTRRRIRQWIAARLPEISPSSRNR
jgi:drug/metabolite transporter (DMT)-like permease